MEGNGDRDRVGRAGIDFDNFAIFLEAKLSKIGMFAQFTDHDAVDFGTE